MEGLHPALLPSLERLPADLPVVLLTRHSLREQPASGFAGYDVPLTPEGVALARAWGQVLPRPVHAVYSSPVGRCLETARAMLAGAGPAMPPVQTHPLLVEPGSFVQDLRAVGRLFLELGPVGFANRHFQGGLAGLLPPEEGAARVLGLARQSLGPPGTFSLLVTHDTVLAAVIHALRGADRIDEADWPWMMEGAFLWFDDDHVHWLWRGEPGRRRLPDLGPALAAT